MRLAHDFIVRFILKCLADEQEFLQQPSNFVFLHNLQRPHVLPAAAQERTAFILNPIYFLLNICPVWLMGASSVLADTAITCGQLTAD